MAELDRCVVVEDAKEDVYCEDCGYVCDCYFYQALF